MHTHHTIAQPNHSVPRVPLVFDSPHSGNVYPADMNAALPLAQMREGEDCLVDQLYAAAPEAGATLICATFPRIYIDPNRSLFDIDLALLDKPWPGPVQPSRKSELGIGLIWRLTQNAQAIYNRKLNHTEVIQRIQHYHQPYQKAVKDAIDANVRAFGASWHINCHSMTSVGGAISDDVGVARADFVLGDRDGTSCDREFTMLVYGFLRGLGYSVKINEPYKGVELVSAFSDPKEHRHSLQIEINQRLYLDEATKVAHSGYLPLKADITKLVAVLGEYAAASARDVATHCTHHDHHHGHDHHEHGHEHPSHDHGHHSHDHGHEHHHHDHKPRHHDH